MCANLFEDPIIDDPTLTTLPLGRETAHPNEYDPAVLFAILRSESREAYLSGDLPFAGVDIWNAWELTWLGAGNRPMVATAEIRIPADSPMLIESKSLKLYLGSFAMSRYQDPAAVAETITSDLSAAVSCKVTVRLAGVPDPDAVIVSSLPGLNLDELSVACDFVSVDPAVLNADSSNIVEEKLHTHLLRSLCPVTSQPDIGSLAIHYKGPKIHPESLLQYVVSFREHKDFHESCIERMFVDILGRCAPKELTMQARYQRRGGIDINPFRSNCRDDAMNLRLWRQ